MDSNSTHISAYAQVISCDQGNDGDDEHWGWSVIYATLLQSAELMAKEPQIQPLERSLGRISDRTESPENEAAIQAVQLVQGTILACEASRGASGMLSSQQESPEIINNLSPRWGVDHAWWGGPLLLLGLFGDQAIYRGSPLGLFFQADLKSGPPHQACYPP